MDKLRIKWLQKEANRAIKLSNGRERRRFVHENIDKKRYFKVISKLLFDCFLLMIHFHLSLFVQKWM